MHSSTLPLILNKHQFWNNWLENLHFFNPWLHFYLFLVVVWNIVFLETTLNFLLKNKTKKDLCNIERQWSKKKKCACHLSSLCVKSGVKYGCCATGMCGETQEYMVCQGIPFKLKVWASISLLYSAAGTPKSLASLGHRGMFFTFQELTVINSELRDLEAGCHLWSSTMDGLRAPYSDILFMI